MNDGGGRHRVLVLVGEAYGSDGGIARFNRNLIDALAARPDLTIRAYGIHGFRGSDAPRSVVWRAPPRGGKPGFALAAMQDAVGWRPALVICGLIGIGPLALAAARVARARLWSIVHGWEAWSPGARLDNGALRRADLVTAVSNFTRERLLSWCPLPAERVDLLTNTIDLDRFSPGPRPDDLARRYGVDGKRLLLTVGRLAACDRYKGQDRVIRLLRALDRQVGPIHYIIAGDGDDRPRLEALVAEEEVDDLVTFAGRVSEADLRGLYRLADVFVMPSTGEGFGIVFLEALACGCPVVAGNRDGSVEALADGALGRTIDPDDATALREAIISSLADGRRSGQPIPGVERFALPAFRARIDVLLDRVLVP